MRGKIRRLAKAAYKRAAPALIVEHCSQTLYQSLLYLIRRYEQSGESACISDIDALVHKVRSTQRPDGGFDIGYAFNFGYMHRRGESTAPEILMLVPLIHIYRMQLGVHVEDIIQKGIAWILRNKVDVSEDMSYVPYGPCSTRRVAVYNGVSFAQAPVAMWAATTNDGGLLDLARRMNRYLCSKVIDSGVGRVMPYTEPRPGLTSAEREKVDYYHLAQQAEMHFLSAREINSEDSKELGLAFAATLAQLSSSTDVIPYLNNELFQGHIHAWGHASTIAAFVDAFECTGQREYLAHAQKQCAWLLCHAYREDYFVPVLLPDGCSLDTNYYPRSDAWVLASLQKYSAYADATMRKFLDDALSKVYARLRSADFTGVENHASTTLRLMIADVAKKILGAAP